MNPSDLSNDADAIFMGEFYTNLKILSQDLYKKSSHTLTSTTSAPSSTPSDRRGIPGGLQKTGSFSKNSVPAPKGGSSSVSLEKEREKEKEYFSPSSLQERLKQYVKVSQGTIPMEYIERYVNEESTQQSLHHSVSGTEEDENEKLTV